LSTSIQRSALENRESSSAENVPEKPERVEELGNTIRVNSKKPLIVACIPAYNEEYTIAKVLLKAMRYVDKVIVCDDGSSDMTGEIAEKLGAIVIKHERNIGKGRALRDLLSEAEKINPILWLCSMPMINMMPMRYPC